MDLFHSKDTLGISTKVQQDYSYRLNLKVRLGYRKGVISDEGCRQALFSRLVLGQVGVQQAVQDCKLSACLIISE